MESNLLNRGLVIGLTLALIFFVNYLYRSKNLAGARQRFTVLHGCQPPPLYSYRDPIFGLDEFLASIRASKEHTYLAREQMLHDTYGYTFSSHHFGTAVLNTAEPDNIKTVLATNFEEYIIGARRKRAFAPLFGNSIFQKDDGPWRSSRALLRSCFQHSQMTDISIFEPHVSNFIKAVPRDGSMVDLALLFDRLTADIATDFLFGESINSLEHPTLLGTGTLKAIHDSQAGCEFRWLLGMLSVVFPQPKFFRDVKIVHQYIRKHVDKALKRRRDSSAPLDTVTTHDHVPDNFLNKLSSITQDRKVLQDELLTLYFAGTDPTSALLVNLLFVLSKRPDIWQSLREEVQHLRDEMPSAQQLGGMKCINNCIYESLRLHPVVPSSSKFAVKDTVLPTGGGPDGSSAVFVPKGTMVHFSLFTLHRRCDLWGDDSEEFRPERWLSEKQSWKFIPFFGGPRNCLGQDFALRETAYILVRLVQEFESVKSHDDCSWVEKISLACSSKNGAKVVMTPKRLL